jgi:oligopeptide/dipeptide ABC transporter ATP-binding protein
VRCDVTLLEVADVCKVFRRGRTVVTAVDGVSIEVGTGETLGIIGESGSGKSTLGRIAVGLLPPDQGRVRFDTVDFASLSAREMRHLRSEIQVVFQEPLESLNPRMRVVDIVQEPMDIHRRDLPREQRRNEAREALRRVGLHEELWQRRPVQLSGGEQQRVGIARAIVSRPRLLLLDEPTSSLDLSLRAGILQLLLDLQAERRLTYVFVSHDMSTIEYLSTRIAVMYKGRIVEEGPAGAVVNLPAHPYTRQLIAARLSTDPRKRSEPLAVAPQRDRQLAGSGCVFYDRCPIAVGECAVSSVALLDLGNGHHAACLLAREGVDVARPARAGAGDPRTIEGR